MQKTTKKQPPTQSSGKKRKNKRPRPAKTGDRKAHTAACSKLCALTNPFDPLARGSRWPDGNAGQTLPTTLEGKIPIFTDSNGNFAAIFSPSLMLFTGASVNSTTGVINPGSPSLPVGYSNWHNVASEYRLVTGGVEVVPTISQLSAAGVMRVAQVPSTTSVSNSPLNAYSYLYPKIVEKPVRDSGLISSTYVPGGPESRNFQIFEDNDNTFDWSAILVCVTGGPGETTVGYIHYIFNLELKFGASSVFNTLGTSKVRADPVAVTGSNWVLDKVSSVVEGSRKQIENEVRAHAENVVKDLIKSNSSMLPFPLNIVGNTLAATM